MRNLLSAAAIVFTLSGAAQAQDIQKGFKAYEAGNYAAALKEWRPLAEQGSAGAQAALGIMHENGIGVPQDYKEAVSWYRKAAEQGNAAAQYNLGTMNDYGRGLLQDNVLAHMWYNIGSANRSEVGAKNRGMVAERMTAEQIAEAQVLARECMASDYKGCGY